MHNRFDLLDTDVMPIFMITALDIFIIIRSSINCSAVICSPTVIYAIMREATSETYGPRVYLLSYLLSIYLYVWLSYLCKSLQIINLVWPTRLIFLAMGEVLSFRFNLAVSFPSDSRGTKARIVLLPSRITRWGFYHIARIYPSTSCHLA